MKIKAALKSHFLISAYFCIFIVVFFVAAYGYYYKSNGELGVSGHLLLTITGAPSSMLSWFLPHGSLKAIFVAGVLGTLQWYLLGKFVGFVERRR